MFDDGDAADFKVLADVVDAAARHRFDDVEYLASWPAGQSVKNKVHGFGFHM